jgi:hypothetical protein
MSLRRHVAEVWAPFRTTYRYVEAPLDGFADYCSDEFNSARWPYQTLVTAGRAGRAINRPHASNRHGTKRLCDCGCGVPLGPPLLVLLENGAAAGDVPSESAIIRMRSGAFSSTGSIHARRFCLRRENA